jgi:hypothetical protein
VTTLASQIVEPADDPLLETEVAYVKTVARKFRHVFVHPHDDLTCCHGMGCHGSYPDWEEGGYYESTRELVHESGVVIPNGSYFSLSNLTEGRSMVSQDKGELDYEQLKGDHMVMKTFDPNDPTNILSFGFWHAAQVDQWRNFNKVDNAMVVLAIAATGLA